MAARPVILLIGGTDPSGGAGLAADIRTVSSLGVHPCIAVTAVTVQTTGGVRSWMPLESGLVADQIRSVHADGQVQAVKTGMLGTPETAAAVAETVSTLFPGVPLVCDPVLRAGSGLTLSVDGVVEALKENILPVTHLCTPNLGEASELADMEVHDRTGMEEAGRALISLGAAGVLVKGGHLKGNPDDLLITGQGTTWFIGSRLTSDEMHGTGCTLASAIASLIATGSPVEEAVSAARIFLARTMKRRWRRGSSRLLGLAPASGPVPSGEDETSFYLPPAFCSTCGGELSGRPAGEQHLQCRICGTVHYRNPLPAVALLVHDGSRLLLVRRAKPPAEGELCLPGGFMELGETVEECGRRELLEETGLRGEPDALVGLETDTTAYGGIVLTALEVTSWTGDPAPGDDASEVLWTDLDSVPELAFDAHDRLVTALRNRLAGDTEYEEDLP
jgi:hydroxymethylpyrimidine/phosphomethylpyrimidine kinase